MSCSFDFEGRVAVAEDVVLVIEVFAAEDAEAWRCCAARVVVMSVRPSGRLLAIVAVVAVVEAEFVDPAEGGRGECNDFDEARGLAVDFARVWAVDRGDCGLLAVEGEAMFVGAPEEGRADSGGKDCDEAIIDLGRASLVFAVGMRRVLPEGSTASLALDVGGFTVATGLGLLNPKIPEFGLLLGPVTDVVVVLAPCSEGPARVRSDAVFEAPGLGNLLGDESRCVSIFEVEADVIAAFFLVSMVLFASSRLTSSFLDMLPRPAVGWRRDRVRFSPVADDMDDMVSELKADVCRTVT